MGWAWVEILARPCVCECLPSNLSQHFTKHAESHLTRTALCLDPARPCPLHNLLLFLLCSELISSLFTFSGRHSPNTLTPCSSSLSCPLSKNYVPFLWNTYLGCVCVFKCGCHALVNFFFASIDCPPQENGDCVWFYLLLYPQQSGWHSEAVWVFVEELNQWRNEWFY